MPERLRVGYVPYSTDFIKPGDRRRFAFYASARGIDFEIADPNKVYDLIVLSEVADISLWCQYPHGKIVFDFIDSYLTVPRSNVKQWLKGLVWYFSGRHKHLRLDYWATLKDMCRRSDAVVCTTDEQMMMIAGYCSNVHIVLDIHESVVQATKENYKCGSPFHLVWEGLPSNLYQLEEISGALKEVHETTPLVLHVITDSKYAQFLGRFAEVDSAALARKIFDHAEFHPWSEKTVAEIVRRCDLAVIPIDLSDPFVAGKPENKLLLLWRMGIPVLVSSTPAYVRAMKRVGLEAMVCRDQHDWKKALRTLIASEELRKNAAARGRHFAQTHFGVEATLNRWDKVFESLGFRFNNGSETALLPNVSLAV
jgi:glycosyltransferase involved in cell wall biosynthesis